MPPLPRVVGDESGLFSSFGDWKMPYQPAMGRGMLFR
jgi:hypothetical protein